MVNARVVSGLSLAWITWSSWYAENSFATSLVAMIWETRRISSRGTPVGWMYQPGGMVVFFFFDLTEEKCDWVEDVSYHEL